MLMSRINDLAISDSNVNMNIVKKYGTFKLQSDKEITENGKHTADVGFNGLSSINVNVEGGGSGGNILYAYGGEMVNGYVQGSVIYTNKVLTENDDGTEMNVLYISEISRSNANKIVQAKFCYEDDNDAFFEFKIDGEIVEFVRNPSCDMDLS